VLRSAWLKASDLLLMPYPNNEFFANHVSPLKLFEYLSARRPIIASRLPAIMEVLRDGENAVLAEPGNPASLARTMERVMRDATLAEALAARAHSDGAAHTWANRARGILAEFEMAKT
jgi:glycosyltransferase involved in cell wall biosynthesis